MDHNYFVYSLRQMRCSNGDENVQNAMYKVFKELIKLFK